MAEFPELGEHCSWAECGQLDFLPLVCAHCSGTFCRQHLATEAHGCAHVPRGSVADLSAAAPTRHQCLVGGCGGGELTPVTCPDCQLTTCLSHRHPSQHGCPSWARQQQQAAGQLAAQQAAQLLQQQRLARPPAPAPAPAGRSARAARTAALVQLMRLKQRAVGEPGVPVEERLYLLVVPPGGSTAARPVYVSRGWSLGRAVDSLARQCGVRNDNHRPGCNRLQLYRHSDGGLVSASLELSSGDTVVLEHGRPQVTCRPELAQYRVS